MKRLVALAGIAAALALPASASAHGFVAYYYGGDKNVTANEAIWMTAVAVNDAGEGETAFRFVHRRINASAVEVNNYSAQRRHRCVVDWDGPGSAFVGYTVTCRKV